MKTWNIYDQNGNGVDSIEARSESEALRKFAIKHHIPDNKLDAYWAEEADA